MKGFPYTSENNAAVVAEQWLDTLKAGPQSFGSKLRQYESYFLSKSPCDPVALSQKQRKYSCSAFSLHLDKLIDVEISAKWPTTKNNAPTHATAVYVCDCKIYL